MPRNTARIRRPWTSAQRAFVRTHVATLSHAAIARHLGRSRVAVQSYAFRHGFASPFYWTAKEIAYLRAHPGVPAAEIGRALGRPAHSVYNQRFNSGLARRHTTLTPPVEALLRRKHALGWSDTQIAQELHCDRHAVKRWRRTLGLPSDLHSPYQCAKVAAKTRQQCRKAGVPSLGMVRVLAFRKYARENGWPADLRPRAVHILNALLRQGPMTRIQLSEAIGMPWKGSRASLHSNDSEGSYLAHLIKRGLVVSLGRICKGKGKGRSSQIYSIPLWTQRRPHGQVTSRA